MQAYGGTGAGILIPRAKLTGPTATAYSVYSGKYSREISPPWPRLIELLTA